MQGEDRDAAVGIGVRPCVCDSSIVDWQNLQRTLSGQTYPVDHLLQVAEVADTEARLRTEREYRYQCSCHTDRRDGEERFVQFVDDGFSFLHGGQLQCAVVAVLPYRTRIVIVASGEEFYFHLVAGELCSIQREGPLVDVVLHHLQGFLYVPCAQCRFCPCEVQLIRRT